MKILAISPGRVYHDGKQGVRRVLKRDGFGDVTYVVLAARKQLTSTRTNAGQVSTVGGEDSCKLATFATWAKSEVSQEQLGPLLDSLTARRIKVTALEADALMSMVAAPGFSRAPALGEGAVFFRLKNKGLIQVTVLPNFALTSVGHAYLNQPQA